MPNENELQVIAGILAQFLGVEIEILNQQKLTNQKLDQLIAELAPAPNVASLKVSLGPAEYKH